MIVNGYLIFEPGMDRPCFAHDPSHYKKKPGAKVFSFAVVVPDFELVDGHLAAVATPVEQEDVGTQAPA